MSNNHRLSVLITCLCVVRKGSHVRMKVREISLELGVYQRCPPIDTIAS